MDIQILYFSIASDSHNTVHGKGTYVAASNTQLMEEERRKEVEADLEAAIQKGRRCGMKEEEIRSLFELIMEDE